MTKDTMKKKAELLRVLRANLRDWSALFDSLRALKDPESIKVISEQLMCQSRHMQETVSLVAEMTEGVCKATVTIDLEIQEQGNGAS